MAEPSKLVAVELLADTSGNGWSAPRGRYECPPARAKMLIARGHARPIEQS